MVKNVTSVSLTDIHMAVLALLHLGRVASADDVAATLGIPSGHAIELLGELESHGLIRQMTEH